MEFRSAPGSSSLKPRRMPQRKPPFSPFLRGRRLGRWLHRSLFFWLMPLFEAVDNRRGLLGARRRIHGLREHSLPLQRRSWFKLPTIPVAWTQCMAEGATGVGLTETTGAQSRFIAVRREPRVDGASALGATTNCQCCCRRPAWVGMKRRAGFGQSRRVETLRGEDATHFAVLSYAPRHCLFWGGGGLFRSG